MRRSSSWAGDTFPADHPSVPEHRLKLSRVELQMIQRIRQCEAGAYTLLVNKTKRGREGIGTFKMVHINIKHLTEHTE